MTSVALPQMLPVQGEGHVQVNVLTPSVHVPPLRQGFGLQSLMLTQPLDPWPLPEYPDGQEQSKLPPVLVHVAAGEVSQSWVPLVHSLMSVQPPEPWPLPV
jgi:hypothetical protein